MTFLKACIRSYPSSSNPIPQPNHTVGRCHVTRALSFFAVSCWVCRECSALTALCPAALQGCWGDQPPELRLCLPQVTGLLPLTVKRVTPHKLSTPFLKDKFFYFIFTLCMQTPIYVHLCHLRGKNRHRHMKLWLLLLPVF